MLDRQFKLKLLRFLGFRMPKTIKYGCKLPEGIGGRYYNGQDVLLFADIEPAFFIVIHELIHAQMRKNSAILSEIVAYSVSGLFDLRLFASYVLFFAILMLFTDFGVLFSLISVGFMNIVMAFVAVCSTELGIMRNKGIK